MKVRFTHIFGVLVLFAFFFIILLSLWLIFSYSRSCRFTSDCLCRSTLCCCSDNSCKFSNNLEDFQSKCPVGSECDQKKDCRQGYECINGVCEPSPTTLGSECDESGDCELSQYCLRGFCYEDSGKKLVIGESLLIIIMVIFCLILLATVFLFEYLKLGDIFLDQPLEKRTYNKSKVYRYREGNVSITPEEEEKINEHFEQNFPTFAT